MTLRSAWRAIEAASRPAFTTRGQHILAAQRLDRALADGFALAHALDQVKTAASARDSLDDIHRQVVTTCTCKDKSNRQAQGQCC